MANFVNCKFGNIEIEVRSYRGVEVEKWGGRRFQHKITLTCNGKKINFTFYNSQADYWKRKWYLDDTDMKNALENIVDDAICYANSRGIDDFCAELGYEDYNEGAKVFRACGRTYDKLLSLGIVEEDLFDIANYLQEELNA